MDTTAEREAFGEVVAILTLVAAVTVGVILLFLSPVSADGASRRIDCGGQGRG